MENKEWICTHCGGKEFFIGAQDGHACMKTSVWALKSEPIKHEICIACGTIVRSYIENPQKLIKK